MDSALVNPAAGWNSWDFDCLTALSYLQDDRVELVVRVSVFDAIGREHITQIGWRDVVELGPHAFDGAYLNLEFQAGFEARFRLEAAATGTDLALRVLPTRTSAKHVVIELARPGQTTLCQREGELWRIGPWRIQTEGALPPHSLYVRTAAPAAIGRPGERLALLVQLGDRTPGHEMGSIDARIEAAARRHAQTTLSTSGTLGQAPEVMLRAAAWNVVCDLTGAGLCIPASRDWCRDWRGVVLFGWDTFFNGLIAGTESPEHAWANYAAALAGAAPAGFVPNWTISNGVRTIDRSQPPVGALAVWHTYLRDPDRRQLERLYPGLLRWHRWWAGARQTAEGLFAWGSDPRAAYEYPQLKQATHGAQICCCYESGMDNSPMFDGVPYDPQTGQMAQADVGLTALHATDAECLAQIAYILDRHEEAAALDAEAEQTRERMNRWLWCAEDGIYLNRRRDGTFNPRRSPTSFYPLLCGAPTAEQAAQMVERHLLDPGQFWGDYPLPSIARSDPAYRDNDYWRGRIWAPLLYLVVAGLRRYGFDDIAGEIVRRSLRMFLDNWRRHGAVFENYNADTGDGGDVPNSDPLYVWGGLIACAALETLASPTADGVAFGDPAIAPAAARQLLLRGARHDVRLDAHGLEVDRDGAPLLRASAPCRVILGPERLTLERLDAAAPIRVEAGGWPPGAVITVSGHGPSARVHAAADGWIRFEL